MTSVAASVAAIDKFRQTHRDLQTLRRFNTQPPFGQERDGQPWGSRDTQLPLKATASAISVGGRSAGCWERSRAACLCVVDAESGATIPSAVERTALESLGGGFATCKAAASNVEASTSVCGMLRP